MWKIRRKTEWSDSIDSGKVGGDVRIIDGEEVQSEMNQVKIHFYLS